MGSEHRRRARQIFEQAVEVTGVEQVRLLDQECGGDEVLRAAVERLLWADAKAGAFLQEPLLRAVPERSFLPPDRIGPYRIHEKIGEGGMGVVYRAERDDEAFHREVAIKLILQGSLGAEVQRRLRGERQILAGLDHPWIAQIFDGGTTKEGVPYLVMELVEGEPIDGYCEREGLSIDQRIELFRKVCAAVQYSHQKLVVHCDLKPSNILVTAAGEPKLLDFGIAKLLRENLPEGSDEPTLTGCRPLTPEYASPEQLRGEVLSTVSDVYSLGVLLYKLLTGQRPAGSGSLPLGTPKEDVVAPSVVTRHRAPAISHRLRGDLDHIMLKALRPQPEARFGSAERLSEDLERHLNGFPVLARQGSLRYYTKKFLKRHRVPVAIAVAGLLILSVFALRMTVLAGHLSQERAKLQEVVGFFRLFFERAGPLVDQGRNLTLREAVDQNAEMIAQGLKEQPAVKVEIATVLGDIYRELGQPGQALVWSERALVLHRQLGGEDSEAYALGLVQVGSALRELGRFEEAESKTRTGLQWLEAQSATAPSKLVAGLNSLVSLYCFQGRYAEVAEESAAALHLAEERLAAAAPEAVVATANRGLVLRQLGQKGEAQLLYERALSLYRQNLGTTHPHVATLLLNLGLIHRDRGDLALARRTLGEANEQYLKLFGALHYGRIRPLVGLAKLAVQQQDIDGALALYREAIELAMASGASQTFVLRPAVDVAGLMLVSDRCVDGEQLLRDSLEHCRLPAGQSWRYAELEGLLGECLARRGARVEAGALLAQSHERLKAHAEVNPEVLHRAQHRLEVFKAAVGEETERVLR
jgi:serine/threonine-protein kinase